MLLSVNHRWDGSGVNGIILMQPYGWQIVKCLSFGEQMTNQSAFCADRRFYLAKWGLFVKSIDFNGRSQPKAIKETLEGVKDENGKVIVRGIFAGTFYCLQLIDGIYIDTHPSVIESFRPKSAGR